MTSATGARVTEAQVRSVLARVPDPEMPVVSVLDMGMIHAVHLDQQRITVQVLPTFLGCPAVELILTDVREALVPLGMPVEVHSTMAVPWTPASITANGRRALAAAGIAPPSDAADPACPHCGSQRTVMDNAFGPTQCRSLHYCRDCRQPFEAIRAAF